MEQTISDNKVLILFVSQSNQVSLRFKMPCFQLSHFVKCATISSKSVDKVFADSLLKIFYVNILDSLTKEKLYAFKDTTLVETNLPSSIVKTETFSSTEILDFITAHKFLDLPRLSSTDHFYELCPSWSVDVDDSATTKQAICVILMTNSDKKEPNFIFDAKHKAKFIRQISNDAFLKQNAQFTYIYHNVQTDFIEKLLKSSKIQLANNDRSLIEKKVLFLKRVSEKHAIFSWLDLYIDVTKNEFLDRIKATLRSILGEKQKLEYKLLIPLLYHESSQV